MVNPILQNRQHLVLYGLFWVMLTFIHTMLLHWTQSFSWMHAIVEAGIYCLGFSLVGLGIWFVVRFTGLETGNLWNALSTHLAAAALLLLLWLMGSYTLTGMALKNSVAIGQASISDLWWRVALGVVYYLLVALIYYVLIFYQNFKEKQLREVEMKSSLKEAELSMLKAQINPHFIFNSLNSISSLTLTRPEDAHEMIVKLSSFLRYTIGHAETELVSLQQELNTIRLYLEIEKLRFGDKLVVEFHGQQDLPDALRVPNLILQPLIENAIKFGVYESTATSHIHVDLRHAEDRLEIVITNSIEPDAVMNQGKGIGLKNVRGRLQLIYERHDLLKSGKENNQYKVVLTLPQFDNTQAS